MLVVVGIIGGTDDAYLVRMLVSVMFVKELLSARVFFNKRRIVSVAVSATIGTGFRLKRKAILP
jgi:hypothetical protein